IVCLKVTPVDLFWTVMVQRFALTGLSVMSTCIWSPAFTAMLLIVMAGPGLISHQAEYGAKPLLTSCSVPAWISVLSVTRHNASTHPPPMRGGVGGYSASARVWAGAVGAVQSPDAWWSIVPRFSSVPWL